MATFGMLSWCERLKRLRRLSNGHKRGHRWARPIPASCRKMLIQNGVPNGIRTRVSALKGPRPGPLDDGDVVERRSATGRTHNFSESDATGAITRAFLNGFVLRRWCC